MKSQHEELTSLLELSSDEDTSMLEELSDEFRSLDKELDSYVNESSWSDPLDSHVAFMTVSAGQGGMEARDWAAMLLRMYLRWITAQSLIFEIVSLEEDDNKGIASAVVRVEGDHPYGRLKHEHGVHRMTRQSPYGNGAMHTSFASVTVDPEMDMDFDMTIEDKDLREDTFLASGAGGQHVNRTKSAVRITHIPTGIVVSCHSQRSQHQNRATAMSLLKSRLYALRERERKDEVDSVKQEQKSASWGNQIRSYSFEKSLVKDERTGAKSSNIKAILDGDLDILSKVA